MYYTKEYLKRAHREIDTIFRVLFPEHGMAVREEQIMLCHEMLDNLLGRNIALCDAGVGIGKTYAYLVACVLMRKYSLLAEGCSPYEQRPIVISTSSITLQKAILTEYIPFLSRILQENGTIQAPIKAVIRKGKEHFVCDERLEQRIVAIEEKNKKKKDFYFLGRKYDIIIIPTIDEVTLKEDTILIKSDKSFEQWLINNIKTIFKNRLDYCYNLFTEDIVYPNLRIRKMTSRWGVCNRKTLTITLNSNLINYNIETIDYVIIHELSHLVHFNHSKEFWKVVSKYCPNYKQIRKSLKE